MAGSDKRASGAINGLLINPENDYILVSGHKTAEIWTATGELVGKSATNFLHLEQVLQDPHQPDRFLVIERSTTSLYCWEDFQPVELSNKVALEAYESSSRSTTTTFHGPNYLIKFTKSQGNKAKSTLQFYPSTIFNDPEVSPAPLPGYEILGPFVEHFISITENKLLFINTDLWVCSLDLKTFAATQEVKRHFFIPSNWQVASGEIMISFTAKKDFVFVKRSELVIISRGLDFSDVFTLSGVPKDLYR
ncbi:hypothetical protein HYALB_00010039 [Hymenoscyphus albidus]|uniref:Uncharacterized protein n=1 Tax=Hymenoscyphus albidus TaxID=595503 RepID=A0A9N9Q425_9HELO|nr:hypothetical protein HYALB_00010039 [Hymenoscyphus albidus]